MSLSLLQNADGDCPGNPSQYVAAEKSAERREMPYKTVMPTSPLSLTPPPPFQLRAKPARVIFKIKTKCPNQNDWVVCFFVCFSNADDNVGR